MPDKYLAWKYCLDLGIFQKHFLIVSNKYIVKSKVVFQNILILLYILSRLSFAISHL